MLTAAEISQAFLQYLGDFGDVLDSKQETMPDNPLDLPDSVFSQLVRALGLNELEQAALIFGTVGELHPLALQQFVLRHYSEGASQLPVGSISRHLVLTLFGDDPLMLTPESALFRLRLLRPVGSADVNARLQPLAIDPSIVKFLLGAREWPAALAGYAGEAPEIIGTINPELQNTLVGHLKGGEQTTAQLFGRDLSGQYDLALASLFALDRSVLVLNLSALVASSTLNDDLALLERESKLNDYAFVIEAHLDALEVQEDQWPTEKIEQLLANVVNHLHAPVVVLCQEPLKLGVQRPALMLEVPHLTRAEQRELWQELLSLKSSDAPRLRELTDQFDLTGNGILQRAQVAQLNMPAKASDAKKVEQAWEACRLTGRQHMGKLAERLSGTPSWDDLILPPADKEVLEQIVLHVKHRAQVYEDWGMGQHQRGLGITALFSGPSGTGKTMASEVVAHALNLDLYRVDVSNMVSKYIGETEKNLKKIFDAADNGGVILLFDEADSLFGKRGDVQSSNDRFANTQVNYLLQRMESYRGLALLTTNLESGMDSAFMRRLRFTLNFRNPEAAERERIWRRAFPAQIDVSALNFQQLAAVKLAGGNIRSIALNAAFMAAARNQAIDMSLLKEAVKGEWRKLGRLSLDEATFRGWTT